MDAAAAAAAAAAATERDLMRSDGNGGGSGDGVDVSLGADDGTADTHRHQPDTAGEDNSLSLRYDKHDDVCVCVGHLTGPYQHLTRAHTNF